MKRGRPGLLPAILIAGLVAGEVSADLGGSLPITLDPNSEALLVHTPIAGIDEAAITDVELVDLDGDGRRDLVVAWFVSDFENNLTRQRRVSLFRNVDWRHFEPWTEIDAYQRDPWIESRSVFRNGTGEVVPGDFDGDGDVDLAVLPYFGDELWIVENLGPDGFLPHLKFMFGSNSLGNFNTPPEGVAVDLDGDGRDELVYIADAVQRIGGVFVHFWSTSGAVADMQRKLWTAMDGPQLNWTRSLAAGDFDADGQVDLAFSASSEVDESGGPLIAIWSEFNHWQGLFQGTYLAAPYLIADLETTPGVNCADDLLLTDLQIGNQLTWWRGGCVSPPEFVLQASFSGFDGSAAAFGNVVVSADLDRDGQPDMIVRKRVGSDANPRQVEYLLRDGGEFVQREQRLSTLGIQNSGANQILRPRNLAVADVFGDMRCEVVAAFNPVPLEPGVMPPLYVRTWRETCRADVDRDGVVDLNDVLAMLAAEGCMGDPTFNPDADIDRNMCVDLDDLLTLLGELGCATPG